MKSRHHYAICIRTEGDVDLEVRRVYRVLPDESASLQGYLRVVDESGEDYVYPADWFVPVEVPREAEWALAAATPSKPTRAR